MNQTSSAKLRTTLLYCAGFAMLGMAPAALGPTLQGLAEQTATTLQQIGVIFTARALGYLLFSLVAGAVYDRVPGHPVVAMGLLAGGVLMALAPMTPILALLIVLFFFQGAASAFLDVGGNTMIVWLHQDRVAPYMNGLHFSFGFGASIAPLAVAGAIYLTGQFDWAYYTIGFLTLPIAFLLLKRPSPTPVSTPQKHEKPPLSRSGIILRVVFFILYSGCEIGVGGWIYSYGLNLGLMDAQEAAFLTTGFWGTVTIGRLLTIPLSRRWNPRQYLPFLMGSIIISTAILWAGSESRLLVWCATFGVGLSMSSVFPSVLAFTGRYAKVSGATNGWFFAGASTGAMVFPWLIGYLFVPIGPTALPMIVLINITLSAALLMVMIKRKNTAGNISAEPSV